MIKLNTFRNNEKLLFKLNIIFTTYRLYTYSKSSKHQQARLGGVSSQWKVKKVLKS